MRELVARLFMAGTAMCCLGVVALATWTFLTEMVM